MDLKWWFCAKPEFCTEDTKDFGPKQRRIEYSNILKGIEACDREAGVEGLRPFFQMYEFYPYDWSTGKIVGSAKGFVEYIMAIKHTFELKDRIGTKLVDLVDMVGDAFIEMREREYEGESFADDGTSITAKARSLDAFIATVKPDEEGFYECEYKEQMLGDAPGKMGINDLPDIYHLLFPRHIPEDRDDRFKVYKSHLLQLHPDKGGNPLEFQIYRWAMSIFEDEKLRWQYDFIKENPDCEDKEFLLNFANQIIACKDRAPVSYIDLENMSFVDLLIAIPAFPDLGFEYSDNVYPPNWVIAWLADRFKMNEQDVKYFFYTNSWSDDTPLGDLCRSFSAWKKRMSDSLLSHIQSVCKAVTTKVTDVFTNRKIWLAAAAAAGLFTAGWAVWKTNFHEESGRPIREPKAKPVKRPSYARPFSRTAIHEQMKSEEFRELTEEEIEKFNEAYKEQCFTCDKATEDMMNAVKGQTWFFSREKDSVILGHIIVVNKKQALCISHMFSWLVERDLTGFWFQSSDGHDRKYIDISDMRINYWEQDSNDDVIHALMKTLPRDGRDIRMHFYHEGTIEQDLISQSHFGCLFVPKVERFDKGRKAIEWKPKPAFASSCAGTEYGLPKWVVGFGISYKIATEEGMCGLPWVCNDVRARRPFIAGIHCAGGQGKGLAFSVSCETLMEVARYWDTVPEFKEQMVSEVPELPPGWTIVKQVPYERVGGLSKLRKTILHNAWSESKKWPALLYKIRVPDEEGELKTVDPWYNAREPYGFKCRKYNLELIQDLAVIYASNLKNLSMHDYPWPPKVFDIKTACQGIPGFMKGIPRNTSAGYPWNKMSVKKFAFFGKEGEYSFDSPEYRILYSKVLDDIETASVGNVPDWIYQQFLKDELRSEEKWRKGQSRLVMGAPLPKTVISCMYMKDFFRWFQDNRIFNGSAIGINPYSVEWRSAAEYLAGAGDANVDGDFKNFDGNQPPEFDEGYLIIAETYYYNATKEEANVRRILTTSSNDSMHLVTLDGASYIANVCGIEPSGDPNTGFKNTINNNQRSAYVRADILLRDRGYPGGADDYRRGMDFDLKEVFWDRFLALGDDHILSVCEPHRHLMNQKQYGAAMERCGFVYTSAKKGEALIEGFKSISEVSFLKRGFTTLKEYPGHLFADLDLDVILEMPYWLEIGAPPGTLKDVIDIVGKELSAKGLEIYSHWGPIIGKTTLAVAGIRSSFLPITDDNEHVYEHWKRAISAFVSTEVDYA